ncbi:MAG TPA: RimK family alpha-L-glutamate ligase, partial [Pirellulaceae bacterium]|nr:RimK family alpha-L-glutamate ligase [Pirellulaceae bacterium]
MKFAVLAAPDSWYYRDLLRAGGTRHQVEVRSFSELSATICSSGHRLSSEGTDLNGFDAIIVRTMPPGSLEQVVFRMDALGRLEASGTTVVNSPRSLEAAVDKYLSSIKLADAGLPTPRTIVCQTVDDAMTAFHELGGDVVVKPLFGGEGRGITRLTDENLALRAFSMLAQFNAVIYVQEFIEHCGYDIRLFVLGSRVFGMKRINASDWRTNVARGATTESFEVDDRYASLARTAADAVGAMIAGIDILPARDGREFVLEVNAVPGWKALARTLHTDIAALLLAEVAAT